MIEGQKRTRRGLAPPKAGMVAAGGILEVIVEDASLSIAEGDLYKG